MSGKATRKAEYGDFQTPLALAQAVCACVGRFAELEPASLLEPTCGLGSFLSAGLDHFKGVISALGADVNADRLQQAEAVLCRRNDAHKIRLTHADFFKTDWDAVVAELPEPILVLGNPPWVTNSQLGVLRSGNLPEKTNFQKHSGLDAVTGKANFDISEWMLIRLFDAMNNRRGTLAMLCKSSTARKTLCYAWKNSIGLGRSAIYGIDADLHFNAAVDAVLLVARFCPTAHSREAEVFTDLAGAIEPRIIGYDDGLLLSDVSAYQRWKHLCGQETLRWRSGIKHDCAKVMELSRERDTYRNGLGQLVDIEDEYVYPMMKSSHLAQNGEKTRNRFMLVTQRMVGQQTEQIEEEAPKTWAYLRSHADLFDKRASSIYRDRPAFSVFGVGDYTFAPWKVAISGFYKKLAFVPVGPVEGKPVVFDDTSYFLPCSTRQQAVLLATLLNSAVARSFFSAFIFWDAKRPITAELLRRLNFASLATELGLKEEYAACFETEQNSGNHGHASTRRRARAQLDLWPS